jgi:hypothetical protein
VKSWTSTTGKSAWSLNLHDENEVPRRPQIGRSGQRDYGYTSSSLVCRDWLLGEVGATDGTLMAFSKRDGKRIWKSECHDPAGHSGSPVPITVEGIPCVAVLTLHQLVVIRVEIGHEDSQDRIWTLPHHQRCIRRGQHTQRADRGRLF